MESLKNLFWRSVFFPLFLVLIMGVVQLSAWLFDWDVAHFGVFPREWTQIWGILLYPFLHGSWGHYLSNALPLLVLGSGLFYYFGGLGYRILWELYLASGLWLWVFGRASYHIGASGLVYALAAFLITTALYSRYRPLWYYALFVVFWYGSMVWGLFPLLPEISWEGHLMGGLAGIVVGWYHRKQGPKPSSYAWENEVEEEDDGTWKEDQIRAMSEESEPTSAQPPTGISVHYHFVPKKENDEETKKPL